MYKTDAEMNFVNQNYGQSRNEFTGFICEAICVLQLHVCYLFKNDHDFYKSINLFFLSWPLNMHYPCR